MTRRFSVLMLLVVASLTAFAQEKVKKVARPDIPGYFVLDLGFNRGSHSPTNFSQGFWGSRTLNIYYQYPVRILKSKFSFNPGLGFGFDRFKLINNFTLAENKLDDGTFPLINAKLLYPGAKKSQIVADYFDIPMDFRFDTKPDDRARSFSITVGGRVGFLYNGFTKLKYTEDGETKQIKDKQDHGLSNIRYGIYTRVGAGGFNWFAFYNLSPFFQANKGPDRTTMNTLTIGVSINGL